MWITNLIEVTVMPTEYAIVGEKKIHQRRIKNF
jgi:hypothetical protein